MRCTAIQSSVFIRYASDKASTGLSLHSDSNMVCEAYRADAPVKHIVDQECQDMGKSSPNAVSTMMISAKLQYNLYSFEEDRIIM